MTQLVTLHGLPPAFRRFNQLPREDVESLIEVAIAALDEADGDSDFEAPTNEDDFGDFSAYANGPGCDIADAGGGNVEDQGEATAAEDDYGIRFRAQGPGCPVADPDLCATEGGR